MGDDDRAMAAQKLLQAAVGETITTVQVLGNNPPKSLEPSISECAGQSIVSVKATSDQQLQLRLDTIQLDVNLERIGNVVRVPDAGEWAFADGAMPTIRLVIQGLVAFDFRESSKTKRVTLHLSRMV